MTRQSTRREILKGGLAAAGLGVLGIPEWAIPALAQGGGRGPLPPEAELKKLAAKPTPRTPRLSTPTGSRRPSTE